MKLVVLDVEGTIITGYNYNAPVDEDGLYKSVIDPSLKARLGELKQLNCKIVIATGTNGSNLDFYQREFERFEIAQYVSAYQPKGHVGMQSKRQKVAAYFSEEKEIQEKENVYFYDDALNNVKSVQSAGFINAFQVTTQLPLATQLLSLVNALKSQATVSGLSLFSSEAKEASQPVLPTRGYNQEDQDRPCCAIM